MATLFNWIKECFNYYVLGQVSEQLILTINDEKNNISQDVKEMLIASIVQNKPGELVEQINDEKNQIPSEVKADLMKSIMEASRGQLEGKFYYRVPPMNEINASTQTLKWQEWANWQEWNGWNGWNGWTEWSDWN